MLNVGLFNYNVQVDLLKNSSIFCLHRVVVGLKFKNAQTEKYAPPPKKIILCLYGPNPRPRPTPMASLIALAVPSRKNTECAPDLSVIYVLPEFSPLITDCFLPSTLITITNISDSYGSI